MQARVSSRGRITAPKVVRERLGIGAGDILRFAIADGGEVTIRPEPVRGHNPFAAFDERASVEDDVCYRSL